MQPGPLSKHHYKMKLVVIILGLGGWAYGMASYIYTTPLSHNQIMQTITQTGWILFGVALILFYLLVHWLGASWRISGPRGTHTSAPNPEAMYSTYSSKKK
jgi:protein-S-isoprenylcysteine O-methyltransferase Ste14